MKKFKLKKKSNDEREPTYYPINTEILDDFNLSWRAKGLLCFLISHPEEELNYQYLKEESYDKAEFILAASELSDFGLIDLRTQKNDKIIEVIGGF